MKKLLSITFLTIISLAAVLLNMSCKETPQNNNGTLRSLSAGSSAVKGDAAPISADQSADPVVTNACDDSSPNRLSNIKNEIENNFKGDSRLGYQYEKSFDFEPVSVNKDNATLYVWGSVYTNPKYPNDLNNLTEKYKDYLKSKCVTKVVFTPPPGATTTLLKNFEYTTLCEYPNGICSDGTCRQGCLLLKP